ncbi:MAG TPA: M56 family metallopeptidase, partial [Bryobacteraceae bacterium]|nr:M56 family metallopeptidase [Bryobacteraceae bacterium]
MTDIWVVAFVKATVVTAMAACADLTLRHASAGVRHLVWLTASAALFLLPFGALVPDLTLSAPIVMQAAGSISSLSAPPGLRSPLPFFVWIAGCALLLARVVASGVSIARLVHRAQPAGHPVRVTYGVRVPFACGFGRELVLVPPAFEAWPENRRRAVLLHETAHLERRDNWSLLLAEIVRAFYWPNPLVWYAAARLRREQEHAADDSVLRAGIDAAEYAAHLIDIARGQRAPLLLAGAAMRSELAS